MAAGVGLFTRRGKPAAFHPRGEWLAIHCGQNDEHLKNGPLMAAIRRAWPACPPDAALRGGQRSLLGVARFVDGACDAKAAAAGDAFLARYECTKPVAWRADAARASTAPIPYPKGNLGIWHLQRGGFSEPAGCAAVLGLAPGAAAAAAAAAATAAAAAPPAGGQGKRPEAARDVAAGADGGATAKRARRK